MGICPSNSTPYQLAVGLAAVAAMDAETKPAATLGCLLQAESVHEAADAGRGEQIPRFRGTIEAGGEGHKRSGARLIQSQDAHQARRGSTPVRSA